MNIESLERIERLIHEYGNISHNFGAIQYSAERHNDRVKIIERLLSIKEEIREAIMDYAAEKIIEDRKKI